MKKKQLKPVIIVQLILAIIIVMFIYNKVQYYETIKTLTSIKSQNAKLIIYPRVSAPTGTPVIFRYPDPLIDQFFASFEDIRFYLPSHNDPSEHAWFMEISTENGTIHIQVAFHIPSRKNNTVVGELGVFNSNSVTSYGSFQSRQLYQWYQTYSHRWLTPEGTPPAPQP